MKIAVPVKDENRILFGNAGHTPYFAVYNVNGSGMFKSFAFEALRKNPRSDLDHEHDDGEGHHCHHDHDDEEHVREHQRMADAIEDCDYLVVKKACKNTVKSMASLGIAVTKYTGSAPKADAILSEISAKLV